MFDFLQLFGVPEISFLCFKHLRDKIGIKKAFIMHKFRFIGIRMSILKKMIFKCLKHGVI